MSVTKEKNGPPHSKEDANLELKQKAKTIKRAADSKSIVTKPAPKSGVVRKAPQLGNFADLPRLDREITAWGTGVISSEPTIRCKPAMSATLERSPETSENRRYSNSLGIRKKKVTEKEDNSTLYVIRSKKAVAAQALSRSDISFHPDARVAQISLLKEFRSDTQISSIQEVSRWVKDQLPGRKMANGGLITGGMVVSMNKDEATRLSAEVPGLEILRNRALTLIPPKITSAVTKTLPKDAAWHLEAIGMSAARRDGKSYSGRNVTIALLDTGVQIDHPEIAGKVDSAWRMRTNAKELDAQAIQQDTAHFDTDGHGTHVAGIICGKNVGVAPDARLISLLMMPYKLATLIDFSRCLDWAGERPEISLINFSAGVTPFSPDLVPLIADLITIGTLPIIAVGNDGPNQTRSPGNYIDGISVGSVDAPGQRVSAFSGSGMQLWNQTQYGVPDCVAPGANIWSCSPADQYVAMSGTSMAAPIVTGIAACIIEQNGGDLSPLDLVDAINRSCRKLGGEADLRQGAGIIQAPLRA